MSLIEHIGKVHGDIQSEARKEIMLLTFSVSETNYCDKKSKWAATCDCQQCGILTSVDSDEPMQPPLKLRNSKWFSISSLRVKEIFQQLAKAMIRLCVCAVWSKPLQVAHTTLLEISCHGSIMQSNSPGSDCSHQGIATCFLQHCLQC